MELCCTDKHCSGTETRPFLPVNITNLGEQKKEGGFMHSVSQTQGTSEASFISLVSEFTILFLALGTHGKQFRTAVNNTDGDISGYAHGFPRASVEYRHPFLFGLTNIPAAPLLQSLSTYDVPERSTTSSSRDSLSHHHITACQNIDGRDRNRNL